MDFITTMDSNTEGQKSFVSYGNQPANEWQVKRLRRQVERYVGEIKRHKELAENPENKKMMRLFFDPLWKIAPELTRKEAEIAIDVMKYYPENPKMIFTPASIDYPEAVKNLKEKLNKAIEDEKEG
jgi:hypothetical protein